MKVITKLKILPDGRVLLETIENAGASCEQVAAQMAAMLGQAVPGTAARTQDYFVTPEAERSVDAEA